MNIHAGMLDLVLPPGSQYQKIQETIDSQEKELIYKTNKILP